MAAKPKARTSVARLKRTAISRPEVYRDLENIDFTQVERAFQALTGATRETHWPAWFVFLEAVRSVLLPTGERADWLNRATSHVTNLSRDGKVNRAHMSLMLVARSGVDPEDVRRALCLSDKRFPKLSDTQVREAFVGWKQGKTRGKGNVGLLTVLARLCLFCGAFGLVRKRGQSEATAIDTATNALRQAVGRAIAGMLETGI